MKKFGRSLLRVGKKTSVAILSVGGLVVGGGSAYAQVTNTPTAVLSTLSSNSATAFDTFISITVAAIAIGMVIMYARKGAGAKH